MGPPPRSPPQQQQQQQNQQQQFIQHQMFQSGGYQSPSFQGGIPMQQRQPIRDPEFSDEEYNRGINPGKSQQHGQFNNMNNQYGGGYTPQNSNQAGYGGGNGYNR